MLNSIKYEQGVDNECHQNNQSKGGGSPDGYFIRISIIKLTYDIWICIALIAAHNSCTTSVEISTDH